jgi:hypothetical protein
MNDFSLKREQKFVLVALALAASVVALFVDAKGFLVDSLSAVVGFTAALMLAGPIVRWFKRQTQLAAAIYVVEVRSSILDPTMRRSEQRMAAANGERGEVEPFLENWVSPTGETFAWLDDLELLARVKYLEKEVNSWHLRNQVSNRMNGAFVTADIDNLPESVAGPFRVLLSFFPDELAEIESDFPDVFGWVARYEESPAAAVRQLGFEQGKWPEEFRRVSARANIGWQAAEDLMHAINGYLRGLGTVITDKGLSLSSSSGSITQRWFD